jgi:hypothetical protein
MCCSVTQEGYLVVGAAVQEDSPDLAQDRRQRCEWFPFSFLDSIRASLASVFDAIRWLVGW